MKTNNEQLEPLLKDKKNETIESKGMGSKKWHIMLRMVGRHLAGQGNRPGFLSQVDSFTIKTLTKETLGEVVLGRGLHQDSQQNCYTITYLTKPWTLTCDPCDTENWEHHSCEDPFCAWVICWMPCWIIIFPFTLTSSLLGGCLIGPGRDVYNFSKKGLRQPLDDKKGIPLGLFSKKPHESPERQVMQEEQSHVPQSLNQRKCT